MRIAGGGPRQDGTVTHQPGGPDEQAYAEAASRAVLRPIASPLTLAFLALAVGTFVLAGLQLSWIPITQPPEIRLILMVFVFPWQAVSAIFGFPARYPIAGTGSGLLCGTWLAIGPVTFTSRPGHASGALGLLLTGAAAALLVPATAGVAGKPLASMVIAGAALRFVLTGVFGLSRRWLGSTAAAEGLLLAALALYAGMAFELEDSRLRPALPTLRRGTARKAIAGSPADEFAGLRREAGVRKQL